MVKNKGIDVGVLDLKSGGRVESSMYNNMSVPTILLCDYTVQGDFLRRSIRYNQRELVW